MNEELRRLLEEIEEFSANAPIEELDRVLTQADYSYLSTVGPVLDTEEAISIAWQDLGEWDDCFDFTLSDTWTFMKIDLEEPITGFLPANAESFHFVWGEEIWSAPNRVTLDANSFEKNREYRLAA